MLLILLLSVVTVIHHRTVNVVIVFTVIGNQPQGTINLKYNTLLASDSVHVKLKVYSGVGPYTMIFKNSINSGIDTVKNLTDSSTILLPPSSNDAVFTLLKIIDNNNSTRTANFDKDTARLTILKTNFWF